jgi:hypothetical protein
MWVELCSLTTKAAHNAKMEQQTKKMVQWTRRDSPNWQTMTALDQVDNKGWYPSIILSCHLGSCWFRNEAACEIQDFHEIGCQTNESRIRTQENIHFQPFKDTCLFFCVFGIPHDRLISYGGPRSDDRDGWIWPFFIMLFCVISVVLGTWRCPNLYFIRKPKFDIEIVDFLPFSSCYFAW